MSTLNFTWGTDDSGERGWIAQGYPHFDTTPPQLMAHDVLEHLPRGMQHGAVADEALALGARLYLRMASGWLRTQPHQFGRPENLWYNEARRLLEADEVCAPAQAEPLTDPAMDELLQKATKDAVDEYVDQRGYLSDFELETEEGNSRHNASNILNWMRIGYRAAIARYKDHDPLDVMWLAERLIDTVEEYQHGEEGDRLIIKVNEKDLEFTVTCRRLYGENY